VNLHCVPPDNRVDRRIEKIAQDFEAQNVAAILSGNGDIRNNELRRNHFQAKRSVSRRLRHDSPPSVQICRAFYVRRTAPWIPGRLTLRLAQRSVNSRPHGPL
jgi:hypothetical protein